DDDSDAVREASALGLRWVAAQRTDVRDRLLEVLNSSLGEDARAGAALGLATVVRSDRGLRQALIDRARSSREAPRVRRLCLLALEEVLGEDKAVAECFVAGLDDTCPPTLRRTAAQGLAIALADGKVEWNPIHVEKVEQILRNVSQPCVHAWRGLERLAEARELHASLRLEGILRGALQGFGNDVAIAFAFGSVARHAQEYGSDI